MAKRTVINSQMPNPMGVSKTQAPGRYGSSPAPFDHPQGMGNGSIPTKFYDTTVKPTVARSTVSGSGVPASNLMSPGKNMPTRELAKAKVPKNNK